MHLSSTPPSSLPAAVSHFQVATSTTAPPRCGLLRQPMPPAQADTYCDDEAARLQATVVRTAPVHGCLRKAVATALTTAYVALGQDWRKEAEVHFPQVFAEMASEPSQLTIIR